MAAGHDRSAERALLSLFAINGLRVSEALGADIDALGLERGHGTLTVCRTGGRVVTIPLASRTARAIDLAIGERLDGARSSSEPTARGSTGTPPGLIVRRLARRAGLYKPVGPHTLRHAFIPDALDADLPLRDVQEAASHPDPRGTMRYDRARVSLDRHATYVAAFIARAARERAERAPPTEVRAKVRPARPVIHKEHPIMRLVVLARPEAHAMRTRTVALSAAIWWCNGMNPTFSWQGKRRGPFFD